jgi:hypothetical protein
MLTGTVNMSLADVDKLRSDLKEAQDSYKKAQDELVKVHADKRTVRVKEYIHPNVLQYELDVYRIKEVVMSYAMRERGRYGLSHFDDVRSLEGSLRNCIHIKAHVMGSLPDKEVSYENFDDVKQELRNELDAEYQNEVGRLRVENAQHQRTLAEAKTEHTKELDRAKKYYDEEIERINNLNTQETTRLNKVIEEKDRLYKELETGKKELTKIEELTEALKKLQEELDKEKSKKWYQKF